MVYVHYRQTTDLMSYGVRHANVLKMSGGGNAREKTVCTSRNIVKKR
jgi:hypothetical protein